MITIEMREATTATGAKVSYRELCAACLKGPSKNGFTVDEMKGRLEVMRKFATAKDIEPGETVELDDSQFNELLNCVMTNRWVMPDQAIVDFVDYLKGLNPSPKAAPE